MTDVAAIITAVASAVVPIGGAGAFVWNKIEKRFTAIDGELDKCRAREAASQKRSAVHVTVIELLWQEIARLHPDNDPKPLARAKHLLDGMKEDDQ